MYSILFICAREGTNIYANHKIYLQNSLINTQILSLSQEFLRFCVKLGGNSDRRIYKSFISVFPEIICQSATDTCYMIDI